jgi:uncharacterized membrane protein YjjB (DUF3815 family)
VRCGLGRGRSRLCRSCSRSLAAFCVAVLTSLAVKHDLADPGLRAMIAALAVFLPGAALTTSVLELARGDMIAGSSRLVWSSVQLMLLAFGIVAGIEAVGVSASQAFSSADRALGDWAPWLGVLVFAVGVVATHSAPPGAFGPLLIVLYAHFSSALPVYALFLPGFWLLVPGALSLIGLTRLAGDTSAVGSGDFVAVVGSIIAVALGVLCGTLLLEWGGAALARREWA